MKYYNSTALTSLICLAISFNLKAQPPDGKKWKLIWHDEFDGKHIDTAKWNILNEKRNKDPDGKDAWWSAKNCYLDRKGNLVISTEKRDSVFTTGCMTTKNKFEKAYGYFETRVKLPNQQGHWPAFWIYSKAVNQVGNDGMDGTEIDIFESPWIGLGQDKVQSAMHYDGYLAAHQHQGHPVEGMHLNDGNWHTFAVDWKPSGYKFYYDGKLVWETNYGGVSKVPEYLMLSEEVGSWGPNDIRKAKLPDYYIVDYVRVYESK